MARAVSFLIFVALSGGSAEESCSEIFSDEGKRPTTTLCSSTYSGPPPWLSESGGASKPARHGALPFPEFLHLAKNGGGTIVHLHFNASNPQDVPPVFKGVGPTRFEAGNSTRPQCYRDFMTPPRNQRMNEKWNGQPTFCVVRHPLSKLVSALNFDHKSKRCKTNYTCFNELLRVQGRMLTEEQVREGDIGFSPVAYHREATDMSPIAPLANRSKETTPIEYCHLIPQSDYVWNEDGDRSCNYVLRFEHLETEFAALASLYGRQSVDKDTGASLLSLSHKHDHVTNGGPGLTAADIEPDVRDMFHKTYAADFCLLGYDLNVSAPVEPLLACV